MFNYEDFDLACSRLTDLVTDRDRQSVKSLIMAAASLDCVSVAIDICKLLDRFTGCGFEFIVKEIAIIHRTFFKHD